MDERRGAPSDDGARGEQQGSGAGQGVGADPLTLLAGVEHAVSALANAEVDALADAEVAALLERLRRPLVQLDGVRARVAALSQRRRVADGPDAAVTGRLLDHQRELGQQQRQSPAEVKKSIAAGKAANDHPAVDRALRAGDLDASQARLVGRVLRAVAEEDRAAVEQELLELAQRLDPVAFGRAARRVLARLRPQALAEDERRQHLRRRFRACDTEDGGFAFSGLLYGVAAEQAREAVRAFRRPDTPGEHRTPEQRGADAFEQLCAAAMAAGSAPTRHGARPQVMVVMQAEDLAALETDPGSVAGRFLGSGQSISGTGLRHLVADSELIRMVVDARGVPTEVSTTVRTVPQGLWRALQLRDGGCVWPGCDAPPAWCDVAHGAQAYTDGGKLSLDNSMLLCRRHHRRFDAGDREVAIDGPQVRFPSLAGTASPMDAAPVGVADDGPPGSGVPPGPGVSGVPPDQPTRDL